MQHLLGIGHIKRAALLVEGWVKAGLEVTVVLGGEPVPQFDFQGARVIQLPPLKSRDADFSGLVDVQGREPDEAFRQRRCAMLISAFENEKPDILAIESYPFGRRQLRWELLPLLERASSRSIRPMIVSSVRDIVQGRRPERVRETLGLIDQYFDAVLVHGDRRFLPFSASFPEAHLIERKLVYTGYVTGSQTSTGTTDLGRGEVIVSAGGGAVGFRLMDAALRARAKTTLSDVTWRCLVGPNLPREHLEQLESLRAPNVIIEPVRRDFPELLTNCQVSISQGGYNTMMDLLGVHTPAVVVPFEGEGETEQLERSRRLAALNRCVVVREQVLDPDALAAAVDQSLGLKPDEVQIDLDGAEKSAGLLVERWEALRG
ncbi:hypothetical protein ADIMK_3482 [Marinobacterium lacunae]|uniref:Glycosyl transferase family 28 C-terminal domain-containing protein n=1 Tax=Marinobacterium lacunae TaxID=1232683 RepID=A0A081FUY7_9GAMM|nr:glycosyltransferase [Marinobacterium lacunae]KEA62342.1 hypothetical protein ADIMK_3482 [Marinobacterium lacunae]